MPNEPRYTIPNYDVTPTHSFYDDDTVRAIGELFLECASAEAALTFFLNELQSHPQPTTLNGMAVITGMQNKLMLEKISTVLSILTPRHHAEFDYICEKIRAIFEHRNNIAHSTALRGSGKRIVVMPLKLRHPVRLQEITYEPSQLRYYAERLDNLVRHLIERGHQIGIVRTREFSVPTLLGEVDHQPPAQ